jgi:hypothetical protein
MPAKRAIRQPEREAKTMPMNPEIKAQWLTDLRSGEFEQGRGYLNIDGKLCCLGVLCEQAVRAGVIESSGGQGMVRYDGKEDVLSPKVREWAGLPETNKYDNPNNPTVTVLGTEASLAELNDGENTWEPHTFGQIADLIEAQL